MERLALIGVSHRRGGAEALEAWQSYLGDAPLERLMKLGFREAVALQTCNRCDLIVALPEEMTVSEAKSLLAPPDWPRCYAYVGEGAVEQLARIASSLDSLNPGEYQIMTQVREAYAAAEKAQTLGPNTRFAFPTAFRIAKRIRSEVELAPINTSLFSLARPELEEHLAEDARVGIIGTGEIGRLAAKVLQERPSTKLYLINRTPARAQAVADELTLSSTVMSLDEFLQEPPSLDALICATPVAQLVDRALMERLPALEIVVDLGIPRNVDEIAAKERGISVLNVDTLQAAGDERRKKIEANLARAEELLLESLDEAIGEWIERQLGPSIQSLRAHYAELLMQFGGELDEQVRGRIASRMAHVPLKGLRALAREFGMRPAMAFLKSAELM